MGYLKDASEHGLIFHLNNFNLIQQKQIEILQDADTQKYKERRDQLINGKIDPTQLLVWLIENYPESREVLRKEPDFQNKFI